MITIGCDNAAFELKETIKNHLKTLNIQVKDVSPVETDLKLYPDVAKDVSLSVKSGESERGIILCGTGIGVSIAANKIPGIRAALCHDTFSAERAQKSNNAQIITMGARVIGPELAKKIVDSWLASSFVDGPSTEKVNLITTIEAQYLHDK